MQVYNISNQFNDKMIHNANQSKTFREEFATMLPASIKQIEQAETYHRDKRCYADSA